MAHAHKFFDAAELIATDVTDDEANASVAASLAVLAGIAACDAACCARLGRRSRSQDHHDAERLLTKIVPKGRDAAKDLRRLLNLKDAAQYGVIHVSAAELRSALRRARSRQGTLNVSITRLVCSCCARRRRSARGPCVRRIW